MLDWDDLRLFLSVARDGSFIGAGRRLGINHSTVSRRLSALERAVDARLFDRSPRGISPTHAGLTLLAHAERIEAEVLAATGDVAARDSDVAGTVRLATPEAFGTFLVAPNIPLLHARHPRLQLELAPETRTVSLSKREADIAIGFRQPPRGRLVARRLTDYRLGLYASREYLERAGPVRDPADLSAHPFVWYIDEYLDAPELRFLGQIVSGARTVFRSSSIAAQQAAVAAGVGIGALHLFTAGRDPRLVRVLAGSVEIQRSYWLILHTDQQRLPRVRAAIDFLNQVVDQNRDAF